MRTNELAHYGVRGMKWGVRRYQNKDGSLTAAGRKRYSDDGPSGKTAKPKASNGKVSTSEAPKKKSISEMSDDERRSEVSRLNLQKTYRDLMKSAYPPKKTASDRGKEIVSDILTNSAKNIGQQVATYVMGRGVNKVLKDIFDDPQVVNPKKGQKDK